MSEPSSPSSGTPRKPSFTQQIMLAPARMFTGLANAFARPAGHIVSLRSASQTTEELRSLVQSAELSGEYEPQETELINSAIEFSDTVAREIMTPRTDVDSAPVDANPYDILEIIETSGHSRIPIYEGTDDDIIGFIHAKDLLIAMQRGKPVSTRNLMRPALFTTENRSVVELLREMRAFRTQLAIVKDGFGGTSGIVTIEDLVEELVGEIQDEHDDDETVVEQKPNEFIFDGRTHLDDVNESIGSEFTSEDFDTIGGFVFGLFGQQPQVGDSVLHSGYGFVVRETDGKRILKVQIEKPDPSLVDALLGEG